MMLSPSQHDRPVPWPAMVLVALTGGIGSGKSTVAAMLADRGAFVIDADQIGRDIVLPGGPAYQPVVDRFGPDVVRADGQLDRGALAARVFADPEELAALNKLTHPLIGRGVRARAAEHDGPDDIVVVNAALMVPDIIDVRQTDGVIVVDIPEEVAVARLVEQRGFSEDDARARLASQISRDERRRLASFVVDNSGDRAALEEEVDRLWAWLQDGPPAR
jgi:dephospho-CoA kinase